MTPDELLIIDCSADVCSCVLCPKLLSVPCLVLLAPLASRPSNLRPRTATPQTCARAPPCYAPMPLMLRFIESDFRVRSWSRKPREIDPPPPVGRGGQSPPQPSLASISMLQPATKPADRTSAVKGKRGSVRGDLGGGR